MKAEPITRQKNRIEQKNTPQTTNLSEVNTNTGEDTEPPKRVLPCASELPNRNKSGTVTGRERLPVQVNCWPCPSGEVRREIRRKEYSVVRPSPE